MTPLSLISDYWNILWESWCYLCGMRVGASSAHDSGTWLSLMRAQAALVPQRACRTRSSFGFHCLWVIDPPTRFFENNWLSQELIFLTNTHSNILWTGKPFQRIPILRSTVFFIWNLKHSVFFVSPSDAHKPRTTPCTYLSTYQEISPFLHLYLHAYPYDSYLFNWDYYSLWTL